MQKQTGVIFLVELLLVACCKITIAQPDSLEKKAKQKSVFSIGAGYQRGFIFAHSEAVQNTKGAHPEGLELLISWQRNDKAVWDLCNCYPRKGLYLAYYDYDKDILGSSYTAAYFLEPTYKLYKSLFFSFKGTAGFSYLTNPFDSIHNPTNQSYSTHLSAYLAVGLGFWIRLNQHWWLNTSVNYQHESNGGMRDPNKGINWPTAGFALSYQKSNKPFYKDTGAKQKFWKDYALRWDLGLFGMARRARDENGESRRLPLLGISLQASKQVGRINAITLGTEIYGDEKLRVQLEKDSIEASHLKVGILAGHEFLLGRFKFSQRLGVNVFDQTPYFDQLYHRWGIHYQANRAFGFGFNIQAHKQVADFVDFRITYTFQHYTSKVH